MSTVAVVGLGKIGLPLAVAMAAAGHAVTGLDASAPRLAEIESATILSPEAHLDRQLRSALREGNLLLSSDLRDVSSASVVVVIIPVALDDNYHPNLDPIIELSRHIGHVIQPGTLVLFESTLPVGTTRNVLAPELSRSSGLTLGRDLFVAYSPERVLTGRIFDDLSAYPKIVGGVNETSTAMASDFYSSFISFTERDDLARPNGVWTVASADSAELVKLMETTYRDVNIALANEFAAFADRGRLDVWEAITAANSQPYSHVHSPGASVGGHCIPVYPHFYLAGDRSARLPREARRVTDSMPSYVVDQLEKLGGDLAGRRVGILGVTYRANVKEASNSGALVIAKNLESRGAMVFADDPLLSYDDLSSLGLSPLSLSPSLDFLVVHTDDVVYRQYDASMFPGLLAIFDGRNSLDPARWSTVNFKAVGSPARMASRVGRIPSVDGGEKLPVSEP